MAKHMRLQHNIDPPLPGRGGNRKRKRDEVGDTALPPDIANPAGYSAFKVEGRTPSDAAHSGSPGLWEHEEGSGYTPPVDERTNGDYFVRRVRGGTSAGPGAIQGSVTPEDAPVDVPTTVTIELEDGLTLSGLPAHLVAVMDPQTGKIHGRSPTMVKYLVMKAKHRYILEQHENLLEELRVMRNEERRARELKEEALDQVLRSCLG